MKNKSIYNAVVAFSLVISVLIGSVLAIAVISNSTENNVVLYGYKLGSGYTATVCMIVICLILFLVSTFIFKNNFKKTFNNKGAAVSYAKLLVVLALVFYCVYSAFFLDSGTGYGYSVSDAKFGTWNIIVLAFAALSAVYMALSVFCSEKIGKNAFALMSLVPVFGLVLRLVLDYLIQNISLRGDIYRFHLLAVCAMILFAINESRYILGKPVPSIYVFFGITASLFTAVYAIPTLALSVKGYTAFDESAVFCIIDIAFVVYIYIRLFSVDWRNKHEAETVPAGVVAFDESDLDITLPDDEKNT